MARKHTPHALINEGRTGRIIARRGLRRTLGNPKKRNRDLAELLQEMFFKGIMQGKKIENIRIVYSTAGMEYGVDYPVEATDGQTPDTISASADSMPESVVPSAVPLLLTDQRATHEDHFAGSPYV